MKRLCLRRGFFGLLGLLVVGCSSPGARDAGDAGPPPGEDAGGAKDLAVGIDAAAGAIGMGSGGADGSGGAAGGNDAGPVITPPAFDWMGIVGDGQSLAVGNLGVPTTPAAGKPMFGNLKLNLGAGFSGPPFDPNSPALSLVPLVEPIRALVPLSAFPSAYPDNIFGETPHTFMGNQISALVMAAGGGAHVTVHSVIGESGQGIAVLSKGARDTGRVGRSYSTALFEARAIKRLAAAAGKSYGIAAIVMTHGEQDATDMGYEAGVHQLWADFNADLRAITGQAASIPMFLSQQHSAPFEAGSSAPSALVAWRLGVKYPGDFVCTGPKYQYQYESEGRHLGAHEYDRLGEKYAQIYVQRVVLGHDWQPLQPTSVSRNGRTIRVDFHVPVPPLGWDENIPPPHQSALTEWAKGRGFEVTHGAGRAAIDSVAIDGSSVVITVGQDVTGTGWTVGYAQAQDAAGAMAGPTRGRRGQLRDSDPLVGLDAETITCQVTAGSAQVRAMTAGAFRAHGGRDIAEAAGLPADTIVVSKTSDSELTLSRPWPGPSGSASIRLRSDHRNYAVVFELPVP